MHAYKKFMPRVGHYQGKQMTIFKLGIFSFTGKLQWFPVLSTPSGAVALALHPKTMQPLHGAN
jgi:hypothetical protein